MSFALKLFGVPAIERGGRPVAGRGSQRRRLALLARLASAGGRGVPRDQLIELLWPGSNPSRGGHLISDSIYRVNQLLGGEGIANLGDALRLDPTVLPSDVAAFESASRIGNHDRAVESYGGPFMDGFHLPDAPEFDVWADGERERYRRQWAAALEAQARAAAESGNTVRAVEGWRRLAEADPCNGRVALGLVQALEAAGERAAAIRHAQAHARTLADELGVEPDPEFTRYLESLRSVPARTMEAAGATPRPSVAVLPFRNLSATSACDFFAEGITEDVIAQLSKIRVLRVLSRSASDPYRNRTSSLRGMGTRLGVAALLDGSVRQEGERVRIVAQLVDVTTEAQLWAEVYDRQLTDIFAIQTDVALQIAAALRTELSSSEATRIRKEPTTSFPAYRSYLLGKHTLREWTSDSMAQGIRYLEEAVAADPGYALAHAALARAWSEMGLGVGAGSVLPKEAFERAGSYVARALELDPELAEAHSTSALLLVVRDYDWKGAEEGFLRALQLNPSSAAACDAYGMMLSALERYDEAIAMQQRAHELDPVAYRVDNATTHLRAGRLDEAMRLARDITELEPHLGTGHATLGWAYIQKDMPELGLASLRRAVELSPGGTIFLAQLGEALALTGDTVEARAILQRMNDIARERYVSPYHFAYIHTGLGEHELAMDYLEEAWRQRSGGVYGIKGSFLFTPLRGHPRFQALLRQMNLG